MKSHEFTLLVSVKVVADYVDRGDEGAGKGRAILQRRVEGMALQSVVHSPNYIDKCTSQHDDAPLVMNWATGRSEGQEARGERRFTLNNWRHQSVCTASPSRLSRPVFRRPV